MERKNQKVNEIIGCCKRCKDIISTRDEIISGGKNTGVYECPRCGLEQPRGMLFKVEDEIDIKKVSPKQVKLPDVDVSKITVKEFIDFMAAVKEKSPAVFAGVVIGETVLRNVDNLVETAKMIDNAADKLREEFENKLANEPKFRIQISGATAFELDTLEDAYRRIERMLFRDDKLHIDDIRIIKEYPFTVKVQAVDKNE